MLVPPMSKLTASGSRTPRRPRPRPARRRPVRRAAARAGRSAPRSDVGTSPPAEVITSTSAASVGEPLEVRTAHRPQVRVDDGRHRALVLADLGRHLVRARDVVPARRAAPRATARSCAGSRSACSRHTATASAPAGTGRDRGRAARARCRRPPAARRPRAAARGHERHGPVDERVVQRGPVLAGDLDHVLEAGVSSRARPRAPLPLQQRVGGDGRAVRQDVGATGAGTGGAAPPRPGRPVSTAPSRSPSAVDDVGERPAGVDADAHPATVGLTPPRRRRIAGSSPIQADAYRGRRVLRPLPPWRHGRTWWATTDSFLNLVVGTITFSVMLTLLATSAGLLVTFFLALPVAWLLFVCAAGLGIVERSRLARRARRRPRRSPRPAAAGSWWSPPEAAGHHHEPLEGDRLPPPHAPVRRRHLRPRRRRRGAAHWP